MAWAIHILRDSEATPPHESAYGIQLAGIDELPTRVRQILSLDIFDPRKTTIQISSMRRSCGIAKLTRYCAKLAKHNSNLKPLIASLKQTEKVLPVQEAAVQLIELLVAYRAGLRDESKQDEVIVFIHFGLKDPSELDPGTREAIQRLVQRVDTPKEAQEFNSGHCPKVFLKGNINIYPRAIENISWYHLVKLDLPDQTKPILELRFMGLRGVFIYILDEIEKRLRCTFFGLDGEPVDAERQEVHRW